MPKNYIIKTPKLRYNEENKPIGEFIRVAKKEKTKPMNLKQLNKLYESLRSTYDVRNISVRIEYASGGWMVVKGYNTDDEQLMVNETDYYQQYQRFRDDKYNKFQEITTIDFYIRK